MNLKSLVFVSCLGMLSAAYASDRYAPVNPNGPAANTPPKSISKQVKTPNYCEVEIINLSFDDLRVWGKASNGGILEPFNIYTNNSAKVDLYDYYYSYCPEGINLNIVTFDGAPVYSDFTRPNTIVRVYPSWGVAKAQLQVK